MIVQDREGMKKLGIRRYPALGPGHRYPERLAGVLGVARYIGDQGGNPESDAGSAGGVWLDRCRDSPRTLVPGLRTQRTLFSF